MTISEMFLSNHMHTVNKKTQNSCR